MIEGWWSVMVREREMEGEKARRGEREGEGEELIKGKFGLLNAASPGKFACLFDFISTFFNIKLTGKLNRKRFNEDNDEKDTGAYAGGGGGGGELG